MTFAAPVHWLVLRWFDNRLGLRRNLRYERHLWSCRGRARRGPPATDAARRALARLRADGLSVLPPPLPAPRVAEIADKAAALLQDPAKRRGAAAIDAFAVHVGDCYRELPEMLEFLSPEVVSVVEGYYGTCFKIYSVEIYRSLPTEQAPVMSWLWHTDDHPAPILKIMVYLTEATEATGAFRAFDRPTSRGLLRRGFRRDRAADFARELEDPRHLRIAEGPRGSVVLFDNNLIHRATAPRQGHRDVIVFEVLPSPEPFREHLARVADRLSAEQRPADYPDDPAAD